MTVQAPSPGSQKRYDLDMTKVGDEELVVLAKECGYKPAERELIERCHKALERVIGWQGRLRRLSPSDLEDAKQNAALSIYQAIERYDTLEMAKPSGCSFRRFLKRVALDHFKDFARRVRTAESRIDRSVAAVSDLDSVCVGGGEQPHADVEEREQLGRLREALEQLDPDDQHLWNRRAAGTRLALLADELAISHDAVRQRLRRLLARLSLALRESGG